MDLNQYPNVWPNLLPALEVALLRHEEATANMADFKKSYTSVKNKVKRIEKYLVAMDEQDSKLYEMAMMNNVRLAENKFALIDKKLNRYKEREQRECNTSLKLLKGSPAMEPSNTQWHIQKMAHYAYVLNGLIRELSDMLRIAKGHLDKVDDMKKTMAHYQRRRMPR